MAAGRIGALGATELLLRGPVEDAVRQFELRDLYNFVDTYHVGVLEGAVRAFGHEPHVRVRRLKRHCDADVEISWDPGSGEER